MEIPVMSEMFNAFLKAQKFTDEEADQYEKAILEKQQENFSSALKSMAKSQNISDYMRIPSQNPTIETKTEVHPHFKNYDHSLEQDRWRGLGESSDGIEWGDLGNI